jgi:hypothetical protein
LHRLELGFKLLHWKDDLKACILDHTALSGLAAEVKYFFVQEKPFVARYGTTIEILPKI